MVVRSEGVEIERIDFPVHHFDVLHVGVEDRVDDAARNPADPKPPIGVSPFRASRKLATGERLVSAKVTTNPGPATRLSRLKQRFDQSLALYRQVGDRRRYATTLSLSLAGLSMSYEEAAARASEAWSSRTKLATTMVWLSH